MPDPRHPELDAIAALLDDAGRQVVLTVAAPLEPASARLMATLGVSVEVRPVSSTAVQDVGLQAQAYRASLANAARRREAGDPAEMCPSCGTEIDVASPAHGPRCSATARVVAAAEERRREGKKMEKGRDGKLRSTAEHDASGLLTAGEMQRRHDRFLDAAPMVARCAVDGCGWTFEGSAAEGRDAARAHRGEAHPELANGAAKRPPFSKPKPEPDELAAAVADRDTDEDRNEGELDENGSTTPDSDESATDTQPAADRSWSRKAVPRDEAIRLFRAACEELGEVPTKSQWSGMKRRPSVRALERIFATTSWEAISQGCGLVAPEPRVSPRTWTRERVIAAVREFALANGRAPSQSDFNDDPALPAVNVVKRVYGSWPAAVEQLGLVAPKAMTREEVIAAVQAVVAELGYTPNSNQWQALRLRPSHGTLGKHFGFKWADIVAGCGIEPPSAEPPPPAPERDDDIEREVAERLRGVLYKSSGREPMGPEAEATSPADGLPETPANSHGETVREDSPGPVREAEPGSRPEHTEPPTLALAVAEEPLAEGETPPFSLALTGDFHRDAQRVRDHADLLRRQAAALDTIAEGIDQLAEAAA